MLIHTYIHTHTCTLYLSKEKSRRLFPINEFNLVFIRTLSAFYISFWVLNPCIYSGPRHIYMSPAFIWINTVHTYTCAHARTRMHIHSTQMHTNTHTYILYTHIFTHVYIQVSNLFLVLCYPFDMPLQQYRQPNTLAITTPSPLCPISLALSLSSH